MPQQDDLVAAGRRLLTNNYRQAPIVFARGEGCVLWDVEGRRYLDMTAGIAVCMLGHGHAALAIARRYQIVAREQKARTEIIACENSFHGRTMGSLSVTGQPKYRDGFGPLVTPVRFIPFGDAAAARAAITDRTAAVIVEPVQGEGGVNLPPAGYLQELRRACTDAGAVLIFDEIQTGTGRTGTFYAFEGERVVPDVVTLAKGMAGGVPIGAMLANEEI